MGFPLNHNRRGLAVYLSGEDSEAEVIDRVRRMTGGETPYGLHVIPARGGDLDEIVKTDAEGQNPRLIVIDPARKYFKGDEDGSDAVNDLFNRIDKSADTGEELRGHRGPPFEARRESTHRGRRRRIRAGLRRVGLDRPRVTLGMLRSGERDVIWNYWASGRAASQFQTGHHVRRRAAAAAGRPDVQTYPDRSATGYNQVSAGH